MGLRTVTGQPLTIYGELTVGYRLTPAMNPMAVLYTPLTRPNTLPLIPSFTRLPLTPKITQDHTDDYDAR